MDRTAAQSVPEGTRRHFGMSYGMSHPWYVLGMIMAFAVFNMVDRYLLAGLVSPIKAEFGVSDTYIGFLLGPSFAILYTTVAIPIARLADRAPRVAILAIGCAVWSMFTFLSAYATDSTTFALMRVGVGLGEAAFVAPAYSLLSDYFPPRKRALAFAIVGAGYFIGQLAGLSAGAAIAEMYGWRAAFMVMGLPGVALALLLYVSVREPVRAHLETSAAPQPSLGNTIKNLWARKSYRFLTLGSALGGFAVYGFAMWGPTYFLRTFEMPLTQANLTFGIGYGLSNMAGSLGGGWLCDRLAQRSPEAPMRFAAASLLSLAICFIAACLSGPSSAVVFLVIGGLLGGGHSAAIVSSMHDLVPGNIRATSTAIWSFVFNFVGLVWGPYTVGVLSDWFGTFGDDGLRHALITTSAVGVLGALSLLRSSFSLAADRKNWQAQEAAQLAAEKA